MALYEGTDVRKRLSGQLTFFFVWLFVTVVGLCLHADPSGHGTHTQLGMPPCPSVLLFNRPCHIAVIKETDGGYNKENEGWDGEDCVVRERGTQARRFVVIPV